MANAIIEIPEDGVQLLEWRVTVHLYTCTGVGKRLHTLRLSIHVQVWGNGCTRGFLTQLWTNLSV